MEKLWSDKGWLDYLYWQKNDKKILARINMLIKDIERNGILQGIGKPERLKHREAYSRRINDEHRLVYAIKDGYIYIFSCLGHYE